MQTKKTFTITKTEQERTWSLLSLVPCSSMQVVLMVARTGHVDGDWPYWGYKLFHPETLISFLPHNFRTLCLRRWGSFFPCLSGGGPKDVNPTGINFHGSSQAVWSFTEASSSCTSEDLLCNFTALLPLLMQHYTLLPAHLVFWMSIHQHTSAGCVILAFLCLSEPPRAPSLFPPCTVPRLSRPSQWMLSSLPSCC